MISARPLPPYGSFLVDDVEAGLAGRLLGVPGEGHLGMAVDAPRHLGVVDRDRVSPRICLIDQRSPRRSRRGPGPAWRPGRRPRRRPASPVCMYSSTSRNPARRPRRRCSSRPRLADSGRRPTEIDDRVDRRRSSPSPKWTVVPDPPSFGLWPCTVTPVRTSMPRFLNDRATTSTTSLSQPGRSLRQRLEEVTWDPRSASIEANSQPMAPPPMTTADSGSWSGRAPRRRSSRSCRRRRTRGWSGAPSPTPG